MRKPPVYRITKNPIQKRQTMLGNTARPTDAPCATASASVRNAIPIRDASDHETIGASLVTHGTSRLPRLNSQAPRMGGLFQQSRHACHPALYRQALRRSPTRCQTRPRQAQSSTTKIFGLAGLLYPAFITDAVKPCVKAIHNYRTIDKHKHRTIRYRSLEPISRVDASATCASVCQS